MTRVGVLGLGRMGSIVAEHLAKEYNVVGWDVREVEIQGVAMVDGPTALLEKCDVLLSFLPSPRVTAEIVLDETFRTTFENADTVFADCSTSDPRSIRELAEHLTTGGERIVDSPVLGRPDRLGAWTIPMGGEIESAEKARPILERLAMTVEHVGPLGSAHTIKLLNNLMFSAINVVTAEAVGACSHLGIAPATFVRLVSQSNAATVSPLFRDLSSRMIGEAHGIVFTTALLHKDLTLAKSMCDEAGVPLELAESMQRTLNTAISRGFGEEDSSALVRLFQRDPASE